MVTVMIEPASADRFVDAQHVFDGGGDGPDCQCQWWMQPNAQWRASNRAEREADFRAQTEAAVPPGLLAYVDGEAAGWVKVGPRTAQARLPRTRIVTTGSTEPMDDPKVWAITCFSVRKSGRKTGLMHTLIDAAVAFAREHGARVVEAYPFDTDAGRISSNDLYVGALSTFLDAGFELVSRPTPKRAVVALTID